MFSITCIKMFHKNWSQLKIIGMGCLNSRVKYDAQEQPRDQFQSQQNIFFKWLMSLEERRFYQKCTQCLLFRFSLDSSHRQSSWQRLNQSTSEARIGSRQPSASARLGFTLSSGHGTLFTLGDLMLDRFNLAQFSQINSKWRLKTIMH